MLNQVFLARKHVFLDLFQGYKDAKSVTYSKVVLRDRRVMAPLYAESRIATDDQAVVL